MTLNLLYQRWKRLPHEWRILVMSERFLFQKIYFKFYCYIGKYEFGVFTFFYNYLLNQVHPLLVFSFLFFRCSSHSSIKTCIFYSIKLLSHNKFASIRYLFINILDNFFNKFIICTKQQQYLIHQHPILTQIIQQIWCMHTYCFFCIGFCVIIRQI